MGKADIHIHVVGGPEREARAQKIIAMLRERGWLDVAVQCFGEEGDPWWYAKGDREGMRYIHISPSGPDAALWGLLEQEGGQDAALQG